VTGLGGGSTEGGYWLKERTGGGILGGPAPRDHGGPV